MEMKFIIFSIIFLIALATISLALVSQKPIPKNEESLIAENVIKIKKQRIETVDMGQDKIVKIYPKVMHIIEGNNSTVISKGRIKIVQQ
jgi:hypothetical protein